MAIQSIYQLFRCEQSRVPQGFDPLTTKARASNMAEKCLKSWRFDGKVHPKGTFSKPCLTGRITQKLDPPLESNLIVPTFRKAMILVRCFRKPRDIYCKLHAKKPTNTVGFTRPLESLFSSPNAFNSISTHGGRSKS